MKKDPIDWIMATSFGVLSLGCAFPLVCLGLYLLNSGPA